MIQFLLEIGLALMAIGMAFLCLGMMLLFDAGLLALGNVGLFLCLNSQSSRFYLFLVWVYLLAPNALLDSSSNDTRLKELRFSSVASLLSFSATH